MATRAEGERPANGQLISVPHRDTIRLLEVYVKRSLSLNDGALGDDASQRKEKWVTKRQRRHSSDPSLHLAEGASDTEARQVSVVEPAARQPEARPEEPEKPTKKPKKKKSSFWKSVLGFFSRKSNEDKDEEQDGPSETPKDPSAEAAAASQPATPASQKKSMRRKSIKRRFSKRRLSLIKPNKPGRDFVAADVTEFEAVVSVEPTYSYYEKVTEELEKIVHEVKVKEEVQPLSDEEVINRIIALTKEQGDAIEDKLKDNPTLNHFFQKMSYSSFQKLADAYVGNADAYVGNADAAPPVDAPPAVLPTAPELVKLAFTLDFTARIAGLARQNVGHITGLGNRYLRDRFEYRQACTDHPRSDSDD